MNSHYIAFFMFKSTPLSWCTTYSALDKVNGGSESEESEKKPRQS